MVLHRVLAREGWADFGFAFPRRNGTDRPAEPGSDREEDGIDARRFVESPVKVQRKFSVPRSADLDYGIQNPVRIEAENGQECKPAGFQRVLDAGLNFTWTLPS